MQCDNCKKEFQGCQSCDYRPEVEMLCCSETCAMTLRSKWVERGAWDELAYHFLYENPLIIGWPEMISPEHRSPLGEALIKEILKQR